MESYQSINTIYLQNVDMSQEYFNSNKCYQILINQSIPIQSNNFIVKEKNISIVMHEKFYCLDNVVMECYNYFIMKQHLFLEDFLALTFMTSFRWILNKSKPPKFSFKKSKEKTFSHQMFQDWNAIIYIRTKSTSLFILSEKSNSVHKSLMAKPTFKITNVNN